MRYGIAAAFVLIAAAAQPPDPKSQDELRGLRSAIERLEKGQATLILLTRIQIDENRLAALEAQRLHLLEQEQTLEKQALLPVAAGDDSPGPQVAVQTSAGGASELIRPRERSTPRDPPRRLGEIRQDRQIIEQAITKLRQRIAAFEKKLDESPYPEPK